MTGLLECEEMPKQESPKPKGRPKRSDRDDITVKVDRGIVSKAKLIAAARKITLAEYISDLLRSPVDRDFTKELHRADKGEPKP